jgi:hypothetical protein
MDSKYYPVINKPILDQIITFHKTQLERFQQIEVSCNTCEHFAVGSGQCKRFDASPPLDVVAKGCHEWLHDPIPF